MSDTRKGANPYDDMSKRTSENRPKLGLIIGGATVAVIAVIAAVVFLWPSGDDGGGDAKQGTGAEAAQNATQENATVQISGEDLPELPDTGGFLANAAEDPAVGLQVPTLTGQSFDESEVTIDGGDGKPKLVVFLAHWCPHCQNEVPLIQDWIDSGDVPDDLDIYAVSTGVDSNQPNYPPSRWLASEGWTPPILLDDDGQSAASSWGLTGFPYFVFVDAEGKVWQRGSGEVPIEDLKRLAGEIVAGKAPTGVDSGSNEGLQTPVDLDAGEPAPTQPGATEPGATQPGATEPGAAPDSGAN